MECKFQNLRKAFIYTLSDPRDGMIRYVCKTVNMERRYWIHLVASTKNKIHGKDEQYGFVANY